MRYPGKFLLISLILISYLMVFAQDETDYVVSTNRPNQTDAIGVMAPGYLQLEAGIGYLRSSGNTFESDLLFFPGLQVRYGIIQKLELYIFYEFNRINTSIGNQESSSKNNFLTIGSKYHLWNNKGVIPETTLVLNFHYTSIDGSSNDWDVEPRLIFNNTLSEKFSLAYMLRYRNNLAFTINPSYAISEKWSIFFEYFSDIRFNPGDGDINYNGINLGFGFLVSNNITLDIMYGAVFEDSISTNLFTTGIGWWIK